MRMPIIYVTVNHIMQHVRRTCLNLSNPEHQGLWNCILFIFYLCLFFLDTFWMTTIANFDSKFAGIIIIFIIFLTFIIAHHRIIPLCVPVKLQLRCCLFQCKQPRKVNICTNKNKKSNAMLFWLLHFFWLLFLQ